MAAF
ncbi:hypothetical protein YPPY46_1397, partial [Yersinia pestis PY-46]